LNTGIAEARPAAVGAGREEHLLATRALDFSVVIPLFNKAPHVEAAVRSALEQTLPPREVIVIDDGSTDGSLEIVRSIRHPALKLLTRSPPGPGGYAARNLGIRSAEGEWVAFLDADDCWHPDHLEALSAAAGAVAAPIGCLFGAFDMVAPDRRWRYPQSGRFLRPGRPLPLETILRAWLHSRNCPIWTGAAAFRRQLLLDAGLFPDQGVRRGGDKDLWLRALALADAAYSPRVTADFHQASVNRVSLQTGHQQLPVITGTIRAMIGTAPAPTRTLLRRLSNQEITLYSRHAAGAGAPTLRHARELYFPAGLASLLEMAAYFIAGLPLKLARARRSRAIGGSPARSSL